MRPERPTILLFDIDGTLLLTGGAGRRAFERAFAAVLQRKEAVSGFTFEGMTDRAIARAGLLAVGAAAEPALIDRLVETYLEALDDELTRATQLRVMPAVRDLVPALRALPDVAVGVGTGNVRRGAHAKLSAAQLHALFDFGGYGCDHEQRSELLRAGALRGAAQLGRPLSACRVVVIGDTLRDVAAAQAIGAECVAVCTGGCPEAELRAAQASAVFADLAQEGVMERLIRGG